MREIKKLHLNKHNYFNLSNCIRGCLGSAGGAGGSSSSDSFSDGASSWGVSRDKRDRTITPEIKTYRSNTVLTHN